MEKTLQVTVRRELFGRPGISIAAAVDAENKSIGLKWQGCRFRFQSGQQYTVKGYDNHHPKYGPQLDVIEAEPVRHNYRADISRTLYMLDCERFPASDQVKEFAANLYDQCGGNDDFVSQVIDMENATNLTESVKMFLGVKELKLHPDKIDLGKIQDSQHYSAVVLSMLGFSVSNVEKILHHFEMSQMSSRPDFILSPKFIWSLLEIQGISINTVDRIALAMGQDPTNRDRIINHIKHSVRQLAWEKRHLWYPFFSDEDKESILGIALASCEQAIRLDDRYRDSFDVEGLIEDIYLQDEDEEIIRRLPAFRDEIKRIPVYNTSNDLFGMDSKMLSYCADAMGKSFILPEKIEEFLDGVEWDLSDEQTNGVRHAFSKLSIVTGGPGTGKTTMMRGVRSIVESFNGQVVAAAPTGKAARRLSQQINEGVFAEEIEAKTLHRLSRDVGDDKYDPTVPTLLVIDESSMLSLDLFSMALYISRRLDAFGIMLVGDVNQLPPVGIGSPFKDMLRYLRPYIQTTELTKIFRQDEAASAIPKASTMVLNGEVPETGGAFEFIEAESDDEVEALTLELMRGSLASGVDPYNEFQVMSARRTGSYGVQSLNKKFLKGVGMGTHGLQLKDKVMQTENNYDKNVMNGEIGKIVKVLKDGYEIDFDGHRELTKIRGAKTKALERAWAITIHKCQGSEYDQVVIPIFDDHRGMWESMAGLLYTAISRGKKSVKVVAQRPVYELACRAGVKRQDVVRSTAWYLDQVGQLDPYMQGGDIGSVLSSVRQQSKTRRRNGKIKA